jgi:hypothetical protein
MKRQVSQKDIYQCNSNNLYSFTSMKLVVMDQNNQNNLKKILEKKDSIIIIQLIRK